jgi:hypothetical protein
MIALGRGTATSKGRDCNALILHTEVYYSPHLPPADIAPSPLHEHPKNTQYSATPVW